MRIEHDTHELGILAAAISAECAALKSGDPDLAALATRVRTILQRANRLGGVPLADAEPAVVASAAS